MDRKLQRKGVLAQAEILEIDGNRVGSHDQPFPVPVRFKLRVQPADGGEPVEVDLKQKVPNDRAYHLEPGAWVLLLYAAFVPWVMNRDDVRAYFASSRVDYAHTGKPAGLDDEWR